MNVNGDGFVDLDGISRTSSLILVLAKHFHVLMCLRLSNLF
ncbi:hypothetical protein OAK04_01930 [Verrucomicrobia bacterium]|nr:hypothetical protein [Verrucomicrobiota bacterium]